MNYDAIADILRFAELALHRGDRLQGKAAISAAISIAPERAEYWRSLFQLEAEDGRWATALRTAELAGEAHPENAQVALQKPLALIQLGRLEEARLTLEEITAAWPAEPEPPVELAKLLWPADPLATLAAVEHAVERGVGGRDETVLIGVSAGALVGAFDRARPLLGAVGDADARHRAEKRFDAEEEAWNDNEAAYRERFPLGAAPHELVQLIDRGDVALAQHVTVRRLLEHCPAPEHDALVHLSHRFGPAGWPVVTWASYSTQRHVGHPGVLMHYLSWLLARAAFSEAARLLQRFPPAVDPSNVLRLKTFCCACGALEREELVDAILAEEAADAGTIALAKAFLANSGSVLPGKMPRSPSAAAARIDDPLRAVRRYPVSPSMRRPRIAVCISGQLRSFKQTWPVTRRALEPWDPVVFVSTWKDVGLSFGAHDTVDRSLPPGVRERLPEQLRRRTVFESRFPNCAAAMARNSSVSRDELAGFYGTEFVQVHEEAPFEVECGDRPGLFVGGNLNQAKMFFTLTDVNAMRSRHELETGAVFDAVVRLRPDRALFALGEFDVRRVIDDRLLLSDYFMSGAVGDQGMLSSAEVADRLADIWPLMAVKGDSRFFAGSTGRFNEFLIAEYLMHEGVRIGRYAATHSFGLTPVELDLGSLWRAILADLTTGSELNGDRRVTAAAFCEEVAERHAGHPGSDLLQPLPRTALEPEFLQGLSERARSFLSACPRD